MVKSDPEVIGAIASFMNYLMQIMMAIIIGGMMTMFASRAFISLGRINEILNTEADIKYDENAKDEVLREVWNSVMSASVMRMTIKMHFHTFPLKQKAVR
ncbi:hypothetical protein [Listeria grayi]|uniref:hypothetical protein n=1 Tax=Listeria grayi TaxID=1641 RepID=UPI0036315A48